MLNVNKIWCEGLLREMQSSAEDYSKRIFRDKVIRVYTGCLKTNRLLLATKIAEKYRKELTTTLRLDMAIAQNLALFAANIKKKG